MSAGRVVRSVGFTAAAVCALVPVSYSVIGITTRCGPAVLAVLRHDADCRSGGMPWVLIALVIAVDTVVTASRVTPPEEVRRANPRRAARHAAYLGGVALALAVVLIFV